MSTFARWGDPADAVTLPESVRRLLGAALQPRPEAAHPKPEPSTLTAGQLSALRGACSEVDDGEAARLGHTAGMSTVDLLALRAGDVTAAPDAVLRPAGHD